MIKRPHAEGPLEILDTPTQLVDLFPTVLDVLDLQPPDEFDGRSVYCDPGETSAVRRASASTLMT